MIGENTQDITIEIKDYDVMINRKNFFDQPIQNNIRIYENIKTVTGHGGDYTTGCLLSCLYFKEKYKIRAINLCK